MNTKKINPDDLYDVIGGGPAGISEDSVFPECHPGSTGLALDAGLDLIAIDRALSRGKLTAKLENGNFHFGIKPFGVNRCCNSRRTSADNNQIIILHSAHPLKFS